MARAKLPDDVAKRVTLNTRTTQPLRDSLSAAAEASGRSLAQEVEHRLEMSFATDRVAEVVADKMEAFTVDFLADSVGGEHLFMSGIYFAMLIHFFEESTGKLATDPEAAGQLTEWLDRIPELLRLPSSMPSKLSNISSQAAFHVAMIAPHQEPSRAEIEAGEVALAKAEAEGRMTGEKGFPVDEFRDGKRRIVAEVVSPPDPPKAEKKKRGKRPLSEIMGR